MCKFFPPKLDLTKYFFGLAFGDLNIGCPKEPTLGWRYHSSLFRLTNFLFMPWSIRYIYIRNSNWIGTAPEFLDSDIFGSDIRPSLDGHGIFGYIFGYSRISGNSMGHQPSQWHTLFGPLSQKCQLKKEE